MGARARAVGGGAGRDGFTLIELLAVVAVVGILVAILIPVLGSMRSAANQAGATSCLRQILGAGLVHASENNGQLAPYTSFSDPDLRYPADKAGLWVRYLPILFGGVTPDVPGPRGIMMSSDATFVIAPGDDLAVYSDPSRVRHTTNIDGQLAYGYSFAMNLDLPNLSGSHGYTPNRFIHFPSPSQTMWFMQSRQAAGMRRSWNPEWVPEHNSKTLVGMLDGSVQTLERDGMFTTGGDESRRNLLWFGRENANAQIRRW